MPYYWTEEDFLEDEFSHSGILGMKWGIRRFQNSDGTYTNLGKERRRVNTIKQYYKAEKRNKTEKAKKISSEIYKDKDHFNDRVKLYGLKYNSMLKKQYNSKEYDELKEETNARLKAEEMAKNYLKEYSNIIIPNSSEGEMYKKLASDFIDMASKEAEDYHKLFNNLQAYYSTRKQELIEDANENNRYDVDFMEYVQNKEVLKSGGKKLQKAYEQYLDNPEKFLFVDLDKLPDQK